MKKIIVFVFLLLLLPFNMVDSESLSADTNSPISSNGSGGLGKVWEIEKVGISGEALVVQDGYIYTFGEDHNFIVTKWNLNGSIIWNMVLDEEFVHAYIYDFAGDGESLYITGYNQTDAKGFIAKISSNGTILWNSPLSSLGLSICMYQEYIYVVNGSLNKIDPINGCIMNSTCEMGAYFVKEGTNSLYLLINTIDGDSLVKWNNGIVWATPIASAYQRGILESQEFLYCLSGDINDKSLILSKFSSEEGGLIWSVTNNKIAPRSFVKGENGFYVVGATKEDISQLSMVKYSFDGSFLWEKSWRTKDYGVQGLYDIALGENDSLYTLGSNIEIVLTKWVYDIISPSLTNLEDVRCEQTDSVTSLDWYVDDENPDFYTILMNGSVVESGDWVSGKISVQINNSDALGQYNYSVVLVDLSGNSASDTVIVTIEDTVAPHLSGSYSNDSETISWVAEDRNPNSYVIYKNGEQVSSGSWVSEGEISITVSPEKRNSLNYTIIVRDTSGNFNTDSIIVSPLLQGSNGGVVVFPWLTILTIVVGLAFLAIVIVVVVLIRKNPIVFQKKIVYTEQ